MNDTIDNELCFQEMKEIEKKITKYLCEQLKLEQLTDPLMKQLNYEDAKKKLVFSLRSLDSDTETSDNISSTPSNRCSLQMARSPLILKRLSTSISEQLQQ
ncbi:unnamed protein product (macronuclear) [Paramecium tetraurelia]|uniref:Uncharacterized protein n=1 Tax=Paramecium tetraurelia TaxID=5888 RepID=A0DZ06_PARTE|nr:uncharacterized protein GSPATT00003242001 [Paramecium tetraurelia]CAK88273.1 unnamed protein product [Paramecium tetraurelia]|eukprot:XP_001455670.1 hypothetical protein (macronuclear) [Paramecium tetraurelia strain d4-2]